MASDGASSSFLALLAPPTAPFVARPAPPLSAAERKKARKLTPRFNVRKKDAHRLWKRRETVPYRGAVHLPDGWLLSLERIPLPPGRGFISGQPAPPPDAPLAAPAAPSRVLPRRRAVRRRSARPYAEAEAEPEPMLDANGVVCCAPLRMVPPEEEVVKLE